MIETNMNTLKRIIYGLLCTFILVYLTGLLSGVELIFLVPLFFFFVLGIMLIYRTVKSTVEGKLKGLLLITGYAAIAYTVGVVYGVLGMTGYYDLYDPLYLTLTLAPLVYFLIGVWGSLSLIMKMPDNKE